MSRAGRIFIKSYLSTAGRRVEAILLKERKAFLDGVVHKLVKIRKNRLFVEVNGSTYVSFTLESEPHTTAPPALQQDPPLSEILFCCRSLLIVTMTHILFHLSHLCFSQASLLQTCLLVYPIFTLIVLHHIQTLIVFKDYLKTLIVFKHDLKTPTADLPLPQQCIFLLTPFKH